MDYPVKLERDSNGTILVSFIDFPEAHTFGDTIEEALRRGQDALATAIDVYIKEKHEIPLPSAVVAKYRVPVPALIEAKVRLYEAMRAKHLTKSALARLLAVHPPQVDRLFDVTHGSKFDQLEAAFAALGKRLVIGVEEASGRSFDATSRVRVTTGRFSRAAASGPVGRVARRRQGKRKKKT